jgi:hypothetical protein
MAQDPRLSKVVDFGVFIDHTVQLLNELSGLSGKFKGNGRQLCDKGPGLGRIRGSLAFSGRAY